MLSKKKKIIILSTMLLLLVITGYLNVALNNNTTIETGGSTLTSGNFFSTHREYREDTRDQEILYYDAIISSASSSSDAIETAQSKKLEIIATMEKELSLEGLIKAKGFEDCVVTLSSDTVSVIVKAETLESAQVAQIVSILQEQTNIALGNIKIIPLA